MNQELRQKQIVEISNSSLRSVLHNIGFKFKRDDNRRALMEKTTIAAQRATFLRKYQENLKLQFPRNVVFLDETWIFSKGTKMLSWQDGSSKSVRKPLGFDGKRFVVLHAGNKEGFVTNGSLIFASKSMTMDYHGEMNSEMFLKWCKEKLIPNLEEPSVIIMDNAPYHSTQLEKQPCSSWTKSAISEWLQNNNVPHENSMHKAELLSLAKSNQKPKRFVVDELLQENGHEVLRLPPYHCQFNAIELIWANAKGYYNKHIGEDGYSDEKVIQMWERALERCDSGVWQKCIDHTEKLISEWYQRDRLCEEMEEIIVNLADDSESDSESA